MRSKQKSSWKKYVDKREYGKFDWKKNIVSIYRSNRFKMTKCISKNEKADIINDDDDENNNQNKEKSYDVVLLFHNFRAFVIANDQKILEEKLKLDDNATYGHLKSLDSK